MRLRLLAVLFIACLTPALQAQRLPRTVVPHHYDLTITPDFATDTFAGVATISLTVNEPVDEIVIHSLDQEFREVTLTADGRSLPASVAFEPANEWARLRFGKPLQAGPATLRIAYDGILNKRLHGLYLGVANGQKYASTQLEMTDARRMFPSFDEPRLKATFALTAIIDKAHVAIANSPVVSDTPAPDGKHTVRFASTPRIATYLVALTIGDFQCLRDEVAGVPLGICGTPDKIALARPAMEATKFIIPWLNDYYGIKYPFAKLDQTGVADFSYGAMENPGNILYRDSILLFDQARATRGEKQGRFGTIAHEIGHIWFGDLVTMRWWDDIWLNEGFATWIAAKPIAAWKPEWKVPLRQVSSMNGTMGEDSLESSRRIRQQATTSGEIAALFDGIAYGKTAAVLAMIESFIGEQSMRRGISSYLKTHSWGNTTYYDFSEAIAEASDGRTAEILRTFVEQPGVPLLKTSATCEGGNTLVTVEQERFYSNPLAKATNELWSIPVCYRAGSERRCEVIREKRQQFRVAGCAPVFLNADGRGYYILQPSEELSDALIGSLADLTAAERLVLVRDEWNLARSGRRGVDRFLRLAEAVRNDPEPLVAREAMQAFPAIGQRMVDAGDRAAFERWVRGYLQPSARRLGWTPKPGEDDDVRALRATVLATLGLAGRDTAVMRDARKLVEAEIAGRAQLDPELADAAITLAAAGGDAKLYDKYVAHLSRVKGSGDYYRYLNALASFESPELVQRTIDYALSDAVRSQDTTRVLGAVVRDSAAGPRRAWDAIVSNWARVEGKVSPEAMRGMYAAPRAFCSEDALEPLRAFYAAHPVDGTARTASQTLETVQQCVAMRTIQSGRIHQWLAGK